MANFNEKVLCLFHKDCTQLKKEADRRGLPYETKEKTAARIIWKDAYDAGFSEGKEAAVACCPVNQKPEVKQYCLYDINEDMKYRLELTEGQVRTILWLIDYDFITDVVLTEWGDSFKDIGQI